MDQEHQDASGKRVGFPNKYNWIKKITWTSLGLLVAGGIGGLIVQYDNDLAHIRAINALRSLWALGFLCGGLAVLLSFFLGIFELRDNKNGALFMYAFKCFVGLSFVALAAMIMNVTE